MISSQTLYYPNRMGRIILLSMEEYPADNTELAFSFNTLSSITDTLEQAYGPHGGRGLSLRVGRACFNYGVRQYSTQLGLTEMAFRLLPLPMKVSAGAK